jgi:hypothetical protein
VPPCPHTVVRQLHQQWRISVPLMDPECVQSLTEDVAVPVALPAQWGWSWCSAVQRPLAGSDRGHGQQLQRLPAW